MWRAGRTGWSHDIDDNQLGIFPYMKQLEKKGFLEEYELALPIIMAPMAGACPPALAAAVSNAGGMGACGALMLNSGQIQDWTKEFKSRTNERGLANQYLDPRSRADPRSSS